MNKKIISLLLLLSIGCYTTIVQAQEERNQSILKSLTKGLEYRLKAGFNIGGTSPCPYRQKSEKLTVIILQLPFLLKETS